MEKDLKTILVLGANGKTGSRVVKKLEALQQSVRKGSRTAEPKFDWDDRATWKETLIGISSVYIAFQPDLAVKSAYDTIDSFVKSAVKAGVQKLVLLSGRGEPEAEQCEKIVMQSGLQWTIIRASWFYQNFSESYLLEPILGGYISLPVGDVQEPFIDADDIADVAVAALTQEGHEGQLYEVTGPHLLSFKEAIAEISRVTKRPIEYVHLPVSDYLAELRAYQTPEETIALISYLFTEVMDGRNASITTGVEKALGRKPKDFMQYVNETVAGGIWTVEA